MTHSIPSSRAAAFALALGALALPQAVGAQSYRYVRSITPPIGEAYYQASFFDTTRNRLATFGFSAPYPGALFQADGALIARVMAPALGTTVGLDGADYDPTMDRGILITQDCRVHEINPGTFALITQRTLVGADTCAGVALGADGNLYVASYGTREIVVYPREGTAALRRFSTTGIGNGLMDNLAQLPGTTSFLVGTNTGMMAIISATGVVLSGPGMVGTAAPLLGGMPINADGATGISTNGQVFFCDHPTSPMPGTMSSCHFYAPGCSRMADCPSTTPVCVIPAGATVGSCAVCASDADCRTPTLPVCDALLRVCLPTAPVVRVPSEGSATTDRRPALSGTASARATVVVYIDGVEVARVTADSMGGWSYTPGTDLALGSHRVYAQTLVGTQRSAASPTVSFRVVSCLRDVDCPTITPVCNTAMGTCEARAVIDAATDVVDATADVTVDRPADVVADVVTDVAADIAVDRPADVITDMATDRPADIATDSGVVDVAVDRPTDAATDSGLAADVGVDPSLHITGDGTCGCAAPGTAGSWRGALGLAAALVALLRRRRAR